MPEQAQCTMDRSLEEGPEREAADPSTRIPLVALGGTLEDQGLFGTSMLSSSL